MKVKASVTIEIEVPDLDSVGDIIHETWASGDPAGTFNACIVVEDVVEVEIFSWQIAAPPSPPVCAQCGKPWPCDMAGLYPHAKKRGKTP